MKKKKMKQNKSSTCGCYDSNTGKAVPGESCSKGSTCDKVACNANCANELANQICTGTDKITAMMGYIECLTGCGSQMTNIRGCGSQMANTCGCGSQMANTCGCGSQMANTCGCSSQMATDSDCDEFFQGCQCLISAATKLASGNLSCSDYKSGIQSCGIENCS